MHYMRPGSVAEAMDILAAAGGNAAPMAGGTDLLVRMKGGFVEPEVVVDLKAIAELGGIVETRDGFEIGAAVPCAALGESAALRAAWPGVVEAAGLIGSKQIQGRCTIAGNLCNASPAADSVPALVAAGARAMIVGPGGRREARVEDIPAAPGRTTLGRGEIIAAIRLAKPAPRSADAYLRFTPRTEMDIAVVGIGISLTLDADGRVAAARVAMGAVAPTVLLVAEAARAIVGTRLDEAALADLAAACSAACRPIDDKRGTIAFRTKIAGVLARRAAVIAYGRAEAR
ncbi:xanthine dehydrogenase family protein subunit M [Devosia sp.]|uniref:FAD binding domain-containing protein n=1 Tax=Devosia sp. TaxID=1871048 RepID=UPI0035B0A52C